MLASLEIFFFSFFLRYLIHSKIVTKITKEILQKERSWSFSLKRYTCIWNTSCVHRYFILLRWSHRNRLAYRACTHAHVTLWRHLHASTCVNAPSSYCDLWLARFQCSMKFRKSFWNLRKSLGTYFGWTWTIEEEKRINVKNAFVVLNN